MRALVRTASQAQVRRHGQPHEAQRFRGRDEDDPSRKRRRDVVGVGRATGDGLPGARGLDERLEPHGEPQRLGRGEYGRARARAR
jgi:hypothetical protein